MAAIITDPVLKVLCECDVSYDPDRAPYDWCGKMRDDSYRIASDATNAENFAARQIHLVESGHRRGSSDGLLCAMNALDQDVNRDLSKWSNLAAHKTDREDWIMAVQAARDAGDYRSREELREFAQRRHARRELEALEEFVRPRSRWANLRRRLVRLLRSRGVELSVGGYKTADADNPAMFAARHILDSQFVIVDGRLVRGPAVPS